jgi:hypothetical protein
MLVSFLTQEDCYFTFSLWSARVPYTFFLLPWPLLDLGEPRLLKENVLQVLFLVLDSQVHILEICELISGPK